MRTNPRTILRLLIPPISLLLLAAVCPAPEPRPKGKLAKPQHPCPGLDRNFGAQGLQSVPGPPGGKSGEDVFAVGLDSQNRVVVAGSTAATGSPPDLVVWRLGPDGALDTSFGGSGWVTHSNAAGGAEEDLPTALAIDSSDRVVVGGWSRGPVGDAQMVIWRFTSAGALDTTFGGVGFVVYGTSPNRSADDWAQDLTIDATGRIVATGVVEPSITVDMAIWRYDASGNPDPSFGTGGVVIYGPAAGGTAASRPGGLVIDPSGRLVVAGSIHISSRDSDITLWRYDATGILDPSFGAGGVVVFPSGGGNTPRAFANDVVLDGSGRIVVTGRVDVDDGAHMGLWRFLDNGDPDVSFGAGGEVVRKDAAGLRDISTGWAVDVDSSGAVTVGGEMTAGDWMMIWRYDDAGLLDTSFGCDGAFSYPGGPAYAMVRDAQGRLLLGGRTWSSKTGTDGTLLRVWP